MHLTPDNLRIFMAAALAGNFTRAARQMNLTQSAVSNIIKRLEDELEKPLFQRVSRGVELTPHGEELLDYARQMLSLHDRALASLKRPEVGGVVRLGAAEDYASQHLPVVLRHFQSKYPLVRVDLYCGLSDELLGMLKNNKLDICLCNSAHGDEGGEFLRYEPLAWAASRDALPEKESPLPLALFHEGCLFRKWALKALDEKGICYRIAYSSPSIAGLLSAVKAGFAVAPIGVSLSFPELRVLEKGVLPDLPRAVISLHQARDQQSKALECLKQYIVQEFSSLKKVGESV